MLVVLGDWSASVPLADAALAAVVVTASEDACAPVYICSELSHLITPRCSHSALACCIFLGSHFSSQPGFRESPIAHDRARRDLQNFGCLINAQPTKETQLNNLTLSLVNRSQVLQRFIERDHLRCSLVGQDRCLVQR